MALNKWNLDTKSEPVAIQIQKQNQNWDNVDKKFTELTPLLIINSNLSNHDWEGLFKSEWNKIPTGTTVIKIQAGVAVGGGIVYKSSENYGTALILPNGQLPKFIQNINQKWSMVNLGGVIKWLKLAVYKAFTPLVLEVA